MTSTSTSARRRFRRPRGGPAVTALAAAALAVPALSGAILLAPAASAQAGPTPACTGATCTVTFGETGAPATWDVPTGVASAAVTLYGASGGSGDPAATAGPATPSGGARAPR